MEKKERIIIQGTEIIFYSQKKEDSPKKARNPRLRKAT